MEADVNWVLFSYRVPYETSTLRVRAWRILRRIGALSLQQSFYIVPNTPETTKKLSQLRGLIKEGQGDVLWLDVERFTGVSTEQLVQMFNQERTEEYEEFVKTCTGLLDNPPAGGDLESETKKIQKWLRKLQARDYFNCPNQKIAQEILQDVEAKFAKQQ